MRLSIKKIRITAGFLTIAAVLAPCPFAGEKRVFDIPVNAGIAPSLHFFPGMLSETDPFYYGVSLDVYAVITQEVIRANQKQIPKKYRNLARQQKEIRLKPAPLSYLPRHLILHPKMNGTGMAGFVYSLFGLNVALNKSEVLPLSAGVLLPTFTYVYIDSDRLKETKHFLGLGGTLTTSAVLKFSENFRMSLGWFSNLYAPIETVVLDDGNGRKEAQWHHGILSLFFHYRFVTRRKS